MAQQGPAPRVYLADLTTQPSKISVCVRVIRKWVFNGNQPGAPATYIGMVLADEKGDSIYAQIHRPQIQQLDSLFQPGGTYMISKFTVWTSKTGYIPFERKFMIEFNAYTTVKEVQYPPATFPAYVYQITPFCNINPYGASGTKMIDLIGIISSMQDPKPLALPKKERVATIRELTIINENNEELKVTLWDNRATEFTLPTIPGSEDIHSVVVLFVGCQPAELHKTIQVYGGNACHWYFNPDIREAEPLYNRLKLSAVPIRKPVAALAGGSEIADSITIEHKTIAELNAIDPYEIPKVGYKCTVTITQIHETPRWWYVGCEKCGKAPEVETVPFLCRCGWTKSTPLYKLTFQAKDNTGEARFFGYDVVSRKIIKRNITFMLRQSRQASGLPQHFQELISRKYTFVVGVTTSSFQDPKLRTYLIKSVSVDHHEQAYIAEQLLLNQTPSKEAGSSSSVPNPQITYPAPAQSSLQTITNAPAIAGTSTPGMAIRASDSAAKETPPPFASDDDTPTKDDTRTIPHQPLKPRALFNEPSSVPQTNVEGDQTLEIQKACAPILSKPNLRSPENADVTTATDSGTANMLNEELDLCKDNTAARNELTKSMSASQKGIKRRASSRKDLDAEMPKSGSSKSLK